MELLTTKERVEYKGRKIETGQSVILTEEFRNGPILIPAGENGKIVHQQNHYEASVMFYLNDSFFQDSIFLEKIEHKNFSNGSLQAMVFNIKSNNFGIKYQPEKHGNITVENLEIPYLNKNEIPKYKSGYLRNGQPIQYIFLRDIVTNIEENFTEWVQKNAKKRKVTKKEKESNEYPSDWDYVLNESSKQMIIREKINLEMNFAKATGFYKEFFGGLIWE